MIVETKYNIKDEVYFLKENKINKGIIMAVCVEQNTYNKPPRISYIIDKYAFDEKVLFKTKQEVVDNLLSLEE